MLKEGNSTLMREFDQLKMEIGAKTNEVQNLVSENTNLKTQLDETKGNFFFILDKKFIAYFN